MKLGIVVSETYWPNITSKMLELAVQTAQEHGAETQITKVPGSFDIPLAVKKLLKNKSIDGVITLGAVIKGDTDHDGVICYSITPALINLSLEFEKPVVLGINGPKMTMKHAEARIQRAEEVTLACIKMIKNTH